MTRRGTLAARAQLAHEKSAEVVRKLGPDERAEQIAKLGMRPAGYGLGNLKDPLEVLTLQAELVAGLAELVEKQAKASARKK